MTITQRIARRVLAPIARHFVPPVDFDLDTIARETCQSVAVGEDHCPEYGPAICAPCAARQVLTGSVADELV
jgi:hypothetical protein